MPSSELTGAPVSKESATVDTAVHDGSLSQSSQLPKGGVANSKPVLFARRHKKVVIPVAIMVLLLPLLGLLALRNQHGGGGSGSGFARAEAVSPIVYPSRE